MMCYNQRIKNTKEALESADFILIGGGAGLSEAAGLHYGGKSFTDNFSEYIEKYGITNMYTAGFYPFKTEEEKWGYWARHIWFNRYISGAMPLYMRLFSLVKNKTYFVITTNADHQFFKAGFSPEKVFAVQGDYGFFQCAKGCHNKVYDNAKSINQMMAYTTDCKITTSLIPICPICSGNMDTNLRKDNYFVQDESWSSANEHYEAFVNQSAGKKVVLLEMGVGYNTPGIIRFPFEQMTYQNENALHVRLNRDHPCGAKENICRTVSFTEDMMMVIDDLTKADVYDDTTGNDTSIK